ncbi:hypothetical protein ACFOYW_09705 [Gryllotalpicola reticulitermitis]|uniref:Glucoamylase (Glucan-1,4-alpha-glucosidase), GH15 family n=1 Tax=Gryllotalpicola reticulitermitis TaxID=1184153 RepID=A0ABV8Q6J9_9MICO
MNRREAGDIAGIEVSLPAGAGTMTIGTEQASADDFEFSLRLADRADGCWDAALDVAYRGAAAADARITVALNVPEAADPYWLIPGLFYGENRPVGNDRPFPRFEAGAVAGDGGADPMTSSSWDFRADRCATPAVLLWAAPGRGGFGLAALAESTELGLTGVGFAHDATTGDAQLRLSFPFREHPITYYGDSVPRVPDAAVRRWQPGEVRRIRFSVFELDADRHAYAGVLRELHAESAPRSPLAPWVDIATAANLAAEGLVRWHFDPDPGVLLETVGFDREITGRDGLSVDRQAMHVGWVSGVPWAYALLAHGTRVGNEAATDAGRAVIDTIAAALSPSGTFWGVWYRDHGWNQSWSSVPNALHSRTLAEATLFLARALRLEPEHPTWERALRSNLDAVVARQRVDGNLGTLHEATTGAVLSWAGSAGLAWVAALAEASDRDPRYLPAALRAGEYYATFVEREYLHGAPEDVDLAPTSEDGYVAVMSYASLYRRTRDQRWLRLAAHAADWTFTFRYSYNVSFDAHTTLGIYGFASRGADQASPSNQHLHAYGLVCTAELRQLSEWTGDPYYRERAEESLACFRQFIAREDGDFNAYRGMATERYYQTACFQPKGMILTLSHAWSVGVLLLACEQVIAPPSGWDADS